MLCRENIQSLWDLQESGMDVMVVKHDYRTKFPVKYLGQRNEDYPCKNWSSVMLMNCGNSVWRRPEYKEMLKGPAGLLHRFTFLEDERIGELPKEWNWLSLEYDYNPDAKLVHHTIGVPVWKPYSELDPYADEYRSELRAMNHFQAYEPVSYDDTPMVSER